MNERILELAKQATIIEEHGWGANYENFDRLKFAELIVQECVKICVEEAHENSDDDRAMRSIEACAWMIKEHFGVKNT